MAKNVVDLRLGVRSAQAQVSLIWRLFVTKKRDVYFAVRTMAGIVKYSFHQSGICRSAFTAEHGKPGALQDRAMYKWDRAPISPKGQGRLSRVLLLAFPTDLLSRSRPADTEAGVTWMEAAPAGRATYLSLSFTAEARADVETAYNTNGTRLLSYTTLNPTTNLLVDYHHADWQNEDLTIPGEGKTSDLLFSASDPNNTGRPIRLVFGARPNDGDALHIRELGGYPL